MIREKSSFQTAGSQYITPCYQQQTSIHRSLIKHQPGVQEMILEMLKDIQFTSENSFHKVHTLNVLHTLTVTCDVFLAENLTKFCVLVIVLS